MKGKTITVLVADGEAIFGDALAEALKQLGGFQMCGSRPTSGLQAVDEASALRPDVALLDFWLRDMEGPASTVAIAAGAPETKVLLLAWFYGPREITNSMAAGAAGFLPKSLSLEQVAEAIRSAADGKLPVIPEALAPLITNPKPAERQAAEVWRRIRSLTPREMQILTMLGREVPIPQMSLDLRITPATVRRHVHHILKKTQTGSQFEAVAFARHYGILIK